MREQARVECPEGRGALVVANGASVMEQCWGALGAIGPTPPSAGFPLWPTERWLRPLWAALVKTFFPGLNRRLSLV